MHLGGRVVMFSKSAQVGRYGKASTRKVDAPESDLQDFTNEYLEARRLKHLRIPDTMDGKAIRKALAGTPDNIILIPLVGGYSLAVPLELKTRSKLRTSQRQFARDIPVIVAQTPDEVERAVTNAVNFAEKVKTRLSGPS
jgi:hypothetical protein